MHSITRRKPLSTKLRNVDNFYFMLCYLGCICLPYALAAVAFWDILRSCVHNHFCPNSRMFTLSITYST